jgi:hypothetical protein
VKNSAADRREPRYDRVRKGPAAPSSHRAALRHLAPDAEDVAVKALATVAFLLCSSSAFALPIAEFGAPTVYLYDAADFATRTPATVGDAAFTFGIEGYTLSFAGQSSRVAPAGGNPDPFDRNPGVQIELSFTIREMAQIRFTGEAIFDPDFAAAYIRLLHTDHEDVFSTTEGNPARVNVVVPGAVDALFWVPAGEYQLLATVQSGAPDPGSRLAFSMSANPIPEARSIVLFIAGLGVCILALYFAPARGSKAS